LDTTSFVPIKHKKINIGWVNNKNQKILNFFEIKNHCIDAKKLQEISKNKKFYAGLDIKKNYEFCPVFEQPSISPNKKFNRHESFGKNKLFDRISNFNFKFRFHKNSFSRLFQTHNNLFLFK